VCIDHAAIIERLILTTVCRQDDVRARNQKNGHLFGKHSSMVGTFLRLDIPIIGFTDQYVLYTDVDVFFRAEVNLDDFSGSLGQRPR
jgi:hypothetical protein